MPFYFNLPPGPSVSPLMYDVSAILVSTICLLANVGTPYPFAATVEHKTFSYIAIAFTYWREGNFMNCKYQNITKRFRQVLVKSSPLFILLISMKHVYSNSTVFLIPVTGQVRDKYETNTPPLRIGNSVYVIKFWGQIWSKWGRLGYGIDTHI